ncbi:MAG: hypothetical protein O8C67_03970 [Candidatus Methanoperedens sp.]|nr:hypothetical protein [Candidatus Methanoperedens sp.]
MLSRRVDHFVESVIRDMTRLSIKHNAINLAQGFPDFPAPEELKRAAASAIMEDYNQYSITWGAKTLGMKYREKPEGTIILKPTAKARLR